MRKFRAPFAVAAIVMAIGWLGGVSALAATRHASQSSANHLGAAKHRLASSLTQSGAAGTGQGATARGDFNHDGFDDLAVGVPFEDVDVNNDAGAVNVLYGSSTGLRSTGSEFWTADAISPATGQANAHFGASLAAGDFNRDGFADLAIGIPGESSGAGAVQVLYGGTGTSAKLGTAGAQHITEVDVTAADSAESGDFFGGSLAAANLGKSANADLAIGVPREDLETTPPVTNAGAIAVIYGVPAGLDPTNGHFITQDDVLVEGTPDENVEFGYSLAGGDFGRSALADLAVGVPNENVGPAQNAGAVQIFYGTPNGLLSASASLGSEVVFGDQLFSQDSEGMQGISENSELFGISLAAANFGKDAHADLAIGVPFQDVTGTNTAGLAGAVAVMYGGAGGLSSAGNQVWTQNSPGVPDKSETADIFGVSLAAADFGNSSESDLAIGAPLDSVGGVKQAGAVNVLYGTSSGLASTGAQLWTQNSTGIADAAELGDSFGISLTAGNYGKGSTDDLTVGVAGEDVGSGPIVDAGAVNVIYGTSTGLSSSGNQFRNQDSTGIPDTAETDDNFSASLGAFELNV